MKSFKRLALTVAALAALAVGGAAFAQAQNAGTVAKTRVETRSVETGTSADPADPPEAGDQEQADGSQEVGSEQESGPEKADRTDSGGEKDSPDGPNDQQSSDDQGGQPS